MIPPIDNAAEKIANRVERRWAAISVAIVASLVVMAAFGGIHQAAMPQRQDELVDPRTLHVSGEFIESNLGTGLEPDGSVTVRLIAQQYSFTPACIVVPADIPVNIRATSADAVHGLLIDGTNVNLMLVPGYISSAPTRFTRLGDRHMPCHEFCGIGHEGMWGHVRVVYRTTFMQLAADRRRNDCGN